MIAAGNGLEKLGITAGDVVGGVLKAAGSGIGAVLEADSRKEVEEIRNKGPNRGETQKKMARDLYANLGTALNPPSHVRSSLPQYTPPSGGTMGMPFAMGPTITPYRRTV